jgi:hypothetical protein
MLTADMIHANLYLSAGRVVTPCYHEKDFPEQITAQLKGQRR